MIGNVKQLATLSILLNILCNIVESEYASVFNIFLYSIRKDEDSTERRTLTYNRSIRDANASYRKASGLQSMKPNISTEKNHEIENHENVQRKHEVVAEICPKEANERNGHSMVRFNHLINRSACFRILPCIRRILVQDILSFHVKIRRPCFAIYKTHSSIRRTFIPC